MKKEYTLDGLIECGCYIEYLEDANQSDYNRLVESIENSSIRSYDKRAILLELEAAWKSVLSYRD